LLPKSRVIAFARKSHVGWLIGLFICLGGQVVAEPLHSRVVCRQNITQQQRDELAGKLRRITGWSELSFDRSGALQIGNRVFLGGSHSARSLITQSISGASFIVLEDVSRHPDVAFARIIPGKLKGDIGNQTPSFVVQIDFADFQHLVGDRRARQAFDVGWALLHELDHVVNDSVDAKDLGETGACESHINQMRRESGLPERADYFFTYMPQTDGTFMTRLVRLAFADGNENNSKKSRYWLVWDAQLVGGLPSQQVASIR